MLLGKGRYEESSLASVKSLNSTAFTSKMFYITHKLQLSEISKKG